MCDLYSLVMLIGHIGQNKKVTEINQNYSPAIINAHLANYINHYVPNSSTLRKNISFYLRHEDRQTLR
jgi:hypothetical protein